MRIHVVLNCKEIYVTSNSLIWHDLMCAAVSLYIEHWPET
jgi:hypothetical protein